ncbi:MAG: pentapeptide repeat-containing protein [Candidatus Alcyoniella australis]|nr:pentapeptide repeat-containing protein [Candidatus Alcyoniella australis]
MTDKYQPPISKEEAIAMLQESRVKEWNELRKENPRWFPHLKGAILNDAHLKGADLSEAHLEGANLFEAHLEGANFSRAHLNGAYLIGAHLEKTNLVGAHLEGAKLLGAQLQGAALSGAHLKGAFLNGAHLDGADLIGSHLKGAYLGFANLEKANVAGVTFNRKTRCRGIRVEGCYGSQRFKRFAQDQDYLEELQETKREKVLYYPWLIFADCGRFLWLLLGLCIVLPIGFGFLFYDFLPPGSFDAEPLPWTRFSVMHYSFFTFVPIGSSNLVPHTNVAATAVNIEMLLGYVMLVILIPAFVSKLARRS